MSQPNIKLDQKIKTETIDKLTIMLKDYVYPEIGVKVSNKLNKNLSNGKYNDITDFREFGKIVTNEMFEITKDKHLLIRYDPEDVNDIKMSESFSGREREECFNQQKEKSSKRNYGYKEIKILPGNIGYIKFNEFEKTEFASKTAHAAIEFISNTDAIILDLRNNNGGWGSMVQLLLSYFIDFQSETNNILLFEKNQPYSNEVIQYRTLPDLPGKRLIQTPLYILTSHKTYSGAEAFTDVLQKRNRAIIIGETTRGGAHSTRGPEILTDYYIVKMPVSEVFNSQTKKNWEGIGIEPNFKIDSKYALDETLKMILTNQIEKNPNENAINRLGYALISDNMLSLAIVVFNENVKRHPNSANSYDSLAEAYMHAGKTELAIVNYRKSLELNPDNTNAKNMIREIEK